MTIGQIVGLVLGIGGFVGLIAYRTWQERRQAPASGSDRRRAAEPRRP
jgi:hypothetical protein